MNNLSNYIPKQLVYYFTCDSYEVYEVYKLHLECIKSYGDIFFKYTFILGFNDTNENELIDHWENIITNYIGNDKNIEYIIVENNKKWREGIHYYNYVYKHLNEFDGLVCWGHSKRDFAYDKNDIYTWISFCHYIMSHDISDIENKLIYDKYLYVGPFEGFQGGNMNTTFYMGSFYWMNPKKIYHQYTDEISTFIYYMDYFFSSLNDIRDYLGSDEITSYERKNLYYLAEHNNTMQMQYMYNYQTSLIPIITYTIDYYNMLCLNDPYLKDVISNIINGHYNKDIINGFNNYYDNLINKLNIEFNG